MEEAAGVSGSRDLCPEELLGLGTCGAGERGGGTAVCGKRRGPVGGGPFRGAVGGRIGLAFGGELT